MQAIRGSDGNASPSKELRHTPVDSTASSTSEDRPLNAVDLALAKLDDHLDATNREVSTLQVRMNTFSQGGEASYVVDKWTEFTNSWSQAQAEAEAMRRELLEDKYVDALEMACCHAYELCCRYLIVYRTVSKQADDMIGSLEKIILQCAAFVQVQSIVT